MKKVPESTCVWIEWIECVQVSHDEGLLCTRCGGPMRIITFIEQSAVIEKILTHLGLCSPPVHRAGPEK
jgi:hypothetical protein